MEMLLPKRRMLELYANVIEMGRGIYGVEAASQHYFGVTARSLTREQAAILAAVLPNPKAGIRRTQVRCYDGVSTAFCDANRMRIFRRDCCIRRRCSQGVVSP